jgi:acetyl-CoA synthetase (ADP-forming)
VALKLCGRKIAHKTGRGLVRLGLGDAAGCAKRRVALLDARRADDGDAEAPRVPHGRRPPRADRGLVRDPQFGPCVMLGVGGIFAGGGDVAFAVAPLANRTPRI